MQLPQLMPTTRNLVFVQFGLSKNILCEYFLLDKKKRITVYAEVVSSEKNLGFKGFEVIKDCNDKFDFPLLTTYN